MNRPLTAHPIDIISTLPKGELSHLMRTSQRRQVWQPRLWLILFDFDLSNTGTSLRKRVLRPLCLLTTPTKATHPLYKVQ